MGQIVVTGGAGCIGMAICRRLRDAGSTPVAMDLAPHGIRVNCVCPGTILTSASIGHMEKIGLTLEQFKAEEGARTLLKRLGDPREVASAILFLASDEASYITGTSLMVDGGYTAA